jgi:hypothetical protein
MLYTNPVHDYTDYVLEELGLVTDTADYSDNTNSTEQSNNDKN